MLSTPWVRHVLREEAITRGLGDIEARILIEWLVDWVEIIAESTTNEETGWKKVQQLCKRCRAISRFVCLWCNDGSQGAAIQLAATERFPWPLPFAQVDPAELMIRILDWETRHLCHDKQAA